MRLSGQLRMILFNICNYSELHFICGMGWRESKAMSNFNGGNEIILSAKYILVLNCNYSELHFICVEGCRESKAMSNFNCDNKIIQLGKYVFNIINCNCIELHVTVSFQTTVAVDDV